LCRHVWTLGHNVRLDIRRHYPGICNWQIMLARRAQARQEFPSQVRTNSAQKDFPSQRNFVRNEFQNPLTMTEAQNFVVPLDRTV